MPCDDRFRLHIGQLLDGELVGRERDDVLAHLAMCPDCARYHSELAWLSRQLDELREAAPPALAQRVRASLEVEAMEAPLLRPAATAMVLERIGHQVRTYFRPALAMLAACLLSAAIALWWAQRMESRDALAHDVLAAHIRSLLQDNPVQVASLDTHTVKPWFAGRLDYTPVVKDLSAQGFKLAGGRLDYVDGRRVAALVYMRRLHKISVFVWPAGSTAGPSSELRMDGYNILSWTGANMTFWAISDLDERELGKLQTLM